MSQLAPAALGVRTPPTTANFLHVIAQPASNCLVASFSFQLPEEATMLQVPVCLDSAQGVAVGAPACAEPAAQHFSEQSLFHA